MSRFLHSIFGDRSRGFCPLGGMGDSRILVVATILERTKVAGVSSLSAARLLGTKVGVLLAQLGVRLEAAKVANIAEDANMFFWQPRGEGLIDALSIALGVVLLGALRPRTAHG